MVAAPALTPEHVRRAALRLRLRKALGPPEPAPDLPHPGPLRDFVRAAWRVVEPETTPYLHNWHIDAICAHLEAVTAGEIRNLLINVPPGAMKSLLCGVFWPAWEWAWRPWTRWLGASYSPDLSARDALKCRRLMQSDWYRGRYGRAFAFAGDQNAKRRYENDRTGFRVATSIGGMGTGERADRLLVDDPHNATQGESASDRQAVLDWWDQAFANRIANPATSARVVIMQRLHYRDLAGHLLELGDFEHLMLPAEYDPARATRTSLGAPDPRTREGELLWPGRFDARFLAGERQRLGPYGYAGQMQQHPIPREGGLFKRHWWRRYRALPRIVRALQFMDTAMKEGLARDWSVIATWGLGEGGDAYLLGLWRGRLALPELERAARDEHAKWKAEHPLLTLVIEDKGHGTALLQTFARPAPPGQARVTAVPFPAPDSKAERDLARQPKAVRAEAATGMVEAGRCWLPEDAPWAEDFIAEHERFPAGEHDDMVDTTSMMAARFNLPAAPAMPLLQGVAAIQLPPGVIR